MNKLSPERRKVVIIAGAVAAGSGLAGLFAGEHPVIAWIWLAILFGAVIYVMTQLIKIKKNRNRQYK